MSETLDSSLSRGSYVTSCFEVRMRESLNDIIFNFSETKVAASMLSKLRLKLGDKLLNVSQREASTLKERQNYTLEIRCVNQSQ